MRTFTTVGLFCYAAAVWLAFAQDPGRWCSGLLAATSVFLFLPSVMAACLTLVCVLLSAVLLVIAGLWSVSLGWGRRSGVGEVVGALLRLGPPVATGYVRVLSRIRSPRVWGFIVGLLLATVHLTVALGLRAGLG
ncbi:MAG: hypothetical protein AAF628_06770 [Planctomycetota bacterium]